MLQIGEITHPLRLLRDPLLNIILDIFHFIIDSEFWNNQLLIILFQLKMSGKLPTCFLRFNRLSYLFFYLTLLLAFCSHFLRIDKKQWCVRSNLK